MNESRSKEPERIESHPNFPRTRIFIDCTQTYFWGGNSGIQRVTRNIANQALSMEHPKCDVIPVIWVGFGFCKLRHKIGTRPYILVRIRIWIRERLNKRPRVKPSWPIATLIKAIQFTRKVLQPLTRPFVHWMYRTLEFLLSLGYIPVRLLFGKFIEFQSRDTVLLIDATWGHTDMFKTLFDAQKKVSIKVVPMLHDLFPLTLPETCESITIQYYTQWFHTVVPDADYFITNSNSTGIALTEYLEEHPEIRPLPITYARFRLGAELDLLDKGSENPQELQPLWDTPGKAILAIGTIEPRKNHSFLLDVFDLLRERGVNVSLIIIGRVGWKSEEVMDRIHQHKDLNTRLLHLGNASDRMLAEAIERCDCLVCPSIAEGFGLPVVEGLMRGNQVFASDIEVFREVGGEHCRYFSLSDPTDLADQLEKWFIEKDRSPNAPRTDFQWPNWKQSAEELITTTLATARRIRRAERQERLADSPASEGKVGGS